MFKITEFSKITGLTIRTLHYYDEIGLLCPIRGHNGHRSYSPNDLILINEIMLLKGMGFTLDHIEEYFETKDAVDLKSSLYRQKQLLLHKIETIEQQLSKLNGLIQTSEETQTLENSAIKNAFIEHNPLKEKMTSIWQLNDHDTHSLQQFKKYQHAINFAFHFKQLAKLQDLDVSSKRVQDEVEIFVSELHDGYGHSFNNSSISAFALIYIENQEAISYLKFYGETFNRFLYHSLIYFSENANRKSESYLYSRDL